ncbi:MAG: hypothetical protein ISR93_03885 [SAR324 cluster bacterium]|nr:hypothetical protein [SAR324 cluster bacterium]
MELDYESLLQLETKGSTAEGEFIPCNLQIEQATFYERNIFANLKHPDYTYKISFKYALLSVGLGILSLAISLSSWLNKI